MFIMSISSRENIIIEKLLQEQQEVTIHNLAKEIAVSTRTIRRDLKAIETLLHTYDLALVRQAGVGIKITGSATNKEQLKRELLTFTMQDYMAEERQTLLLSMLYEAAEPVKLFTLANELHVTETTIRNDLVKLEEALEHFQLMIIRKRGYGIELSGSEEAKRRAISFHISKTLSENEFLSLIKRNRERKTSLFQNAIADRLLHLVDRERVLAIEETIRAHHLGVLSSMTESAYVGLIVHLTLAIDRIERGEKIEMGHDFLNQLQDDEEYATAKDMIDHLANRFDIPIPEAEIGYITMHLQGAKVREESKGWLETDHFQVIVQAKQLIQEVEKKTNHQFSNERTLLEGLVTHLKPALYRIEQNMGIRNPLLNNIRQDYEELFQVVQKATQKVFVHLEIPEEEIGFLVLHFGAAILGFEEESGLTAYVVCSSGIGTSKMLATQLRREVPEINQVQNISALELSKRSIQKSDLIISTIQLPNISYEYLVVHPFLTESEIQQVQMFAKRKMLLRNERELSKQEKFLEGEQMTKHMKAIHAYSGTSATLLENFTVEDIHSTGSFEEIVFELCTMLRRKEVVDGAEKVAKALLEREALGSLGIPGTNMVLLHTKHEGILSPSFTMYRMREPIAMDAMDRSTIQVTNILLLLAPDPFHSYGMEVLSLISSLMIEDEQSMRLFQSGDERKIHAFIGRKFEQFLQEKIN